MTDSVIIVSGLPRSGTSLLMQMLAATGLTPMTDEQRAPDESNPKGYYEMEKVKKLGEDASWLEQCRGRVVKIVSPLLKNVPAGLPGKVLFMRRRMEEILASQRAMMQRMGTSHQVNDAEMAAYFTKHLQDMEQWLAENDHLDVRYLTFHEVVADPAAAARRINEFLGGGLDEAAMAGAVDNKLYRERAKG
jgi:LPS sulfotransferase NodH